MIALGRTDNRVSMNAVIVIAHAPLASALREAAARACRLRADLRRWTCRPAITPGQPGRRTGRAGALRRQRGVLMLTDVLGATPCNVATRLLAGERTRLLAGVNLPMLLRSLCYRHEPLAALARALAGGAGGVVGAGAVR
jgi:PTS system ascorbate-specific IIA component